MTFQQDSIISEEPVANHYLDTIGASQELSWSVKLHVDSQEVIIKIDTGTEVLAISEKVYQDLQWPTLQKPSKFLHSPAHSLQFRQHCIMAKTPSINKSLLAKISSTIY